MLGFLKIKIKIRIKMCPRFFILFIILFIYLFIIFFNFNMRTITHKNKQMLLWSDQFKHASKKASIAYTLNNCIPELFND